MDDPCIRKRTVPSKVVMPARPPAFQVEARKRLSLSLFKRPIFELPTVSEVVDLCDDEPVATLPSSIILPEKVILSTLALDKSELLRSILSEVTSDPVAYTYYQPFEEDVAAGTSMQALHDAALTLPSDSSTSAALDPPTEPPAISSPLKKPSAECFANIQLCRLWKLPRGDYKLVGFCRDTGEAILSPVAGGEKVRCKIPVAMGYPTAASSILRKGPPTHQHPKGGATWV